MARRRHGALAMVLLAVTATGCALLQDPPGGQVEAQPQFRTASALYDKAMTYFDKGAYGQAAELLHAFVGQFPDSLMFEAALYNLATATRDRGRTRMPWRYITG